MTQLVRDQLNSITQGQHGGLLTFGFAMALWSSSAAVVAITDALNRAYDIDEARPWWKVRLTAILLTIGLAAFVLVAMGLVLVGPTIADWLAAQDRSRQCLRVDVEDPSVADRVRTRRDRARGAELFRVPTRIRTGRG